MNDLDRVKKIMISLTDIYNELLSLVKKERECLMNIDTENLVKIIELKQYMGLKIRSVEDELKNIFLKYNAESISEFLFLISREKNVDHIRVINGKLLELMNKFNKESAVNRMITQESVSFYNSMVNMYMSFIRNQNENYDKDATIGITQRALSVKV